MCMSFRLLYVFYLLSVAQKPSEVDCVSTPQGYQHTCIYEPVCRICRSCGDRTDIGKADLWFVLKCRSRPAVILRPF